ncbi:MAG TPA: beta-galactosidase GalA [Chitinophagaceae bacterium]|nr:beta-galactosidase GalA [Chitinophagaceae bacterium]
MKNKIRYVINICFLFFLTTNISAQNSQRAKILFDKDWRFHLGDASDPKKDFDYGITENFAKAGESYGAINPKFNDSNWRQLDLPHDWAVELPFVEKKDDIVRDHGYKPIGGYYPSTSIGWYRKIFTVSPADSGNIFNIQFDGVFRDAEVWLNGHYLGNNKSGYSGFLFNITDYIHFRSNNVLVVRVNATQSEGWYYEGAGIYRHVWLEKFSPVHISDYGTYINSTVFDSIATVTIESKIENNTTARVSSNVAYYIKDRTGKKITGTVVEGVSVGLDEEKKINYQLKIKNPVLWSLEYPYCYTLTTFIIVNDKVVDSTSTVFGIRTIRIDVNKGIFLNGKPIKIHGVCCHQDHAGLGVALPDALQYYRIKKLKEMGVNAYRTSHNPPTPELLQACDELGMLVLDENRMIGTTEEYLREWEKLILRDRNHPCVLMWSIGNEEWMIQNDDVGKRLASTLIQKQKELDPSRTCTYAANNGNTFNGINSVIPVRGFNYFIDGADKYRVGHPGQPVWGSEVASTVSTRGIYANDKEKGYVSDYDLNKPGWGTTAEQWWSYVAQRDWFMGGFVWTGFDYRGEPTPYEWPCINSHFGIMDVCGFPKNIYYYYQSWWTDSDVLHIYPHWNWKGKEGDTINVWCNSNAEAVELKLNGKSLGKKMMPRNGHLEWKVKYAPGKLEAFAIKNGKKLYTKVETTGEAYSIVLSPDKTILHADGRDVCVMNVSVTDKSGREVPDAMNLVKFSVAGNGKIIGVGNGDPSSHEPDKYFDNNWQRKLFNGKCQVIIQSGETAGDMIFEATGEGLQTAKVILKMN